MNPLRLDSVSPHQERLEAMVREQEKLQDESVAARPAFAMRFGAPGSVLGLLFLVLFLVTPVRANWTIGSSNSDKGEAGKVEHRTVVVNESETGEKAALHFAVFSSRSVNIKIIDNPNGDELNAVMRRENGLAGVNGGYFDADDAPVGLVVTGGKTLAPLRKARLLSGVLVVSNNRIKLLRVAEYSAKQKPMEALQCGPFLVDHGRVVPGLNDTRSARRTFVVTGDSDRMAIGYCSDATLAGLGEILAMSGIVPDLKVQRALNLDGGSSSGFWFASERGPYSIGEQKTVRNFVGIIGR